MRLTTFLTQTRHGDVVVFPDLSGVETGRAQ